MTRIEKLEKEIQELRLEVARLEGRIQELSRQHIPFQPYINPYNIGRGIGDVICKRNMISDTPCYCKQCVDMRGLGWTFTSNTTDKTSSLFNQIPRGEPTIYFTDEDFKID